jgi:hypothetical protein
LPLAEIRLSHPSKLMTILLSGDGEWRDLDKTITEDFSSKVYRSLAWTRFDLSGARRCRGKPRILSRR